MGAMSVTPLQAGILGLVEGLTEYLPVSSTGHLILAGQWLGLGGDNAVKDFDVVIQFGAVLAVLGLYRRRVGQMVQGLLGRDGAGLRLLVNLVVAFLPAGVLGLLLEKRIKEVLFGTAPVVAALAVGGVAMIVLDLLFRKRRERDGRPIEALGLGGALIIGFCQCLAMWPGTSRARATSRAGLLVGRTPLAAAEFSFLLALPTLGGATVLEVAKHGAEMAAGVPPLPMAIGLIVAALSAAAAVKAFVAWLVRHGFVPFGVYRIVLALVVLWVLRA